MPDQPSGDELLMTAEKVEEGRTVLGMRGIKQSNKENKLNDGKTKTATF